MSLKLSVSYFLDVMLTKLVSYAEEGDTGHMTCEALSIPEATSVEWTFDGELIDENDERFSSLETKTAEGVRSTLIIRNVQEKDFGPLVCSVSNKYGTDSALFTLKKQGKKFIHYQYSTVLENTSIIEAKTSKF